MISSATSEMVFHRFLFLSLAAFCLMSTSAFGANLPNDEVEALRDIAKTIGKTDWNFTVDPCSGEWGWATPNAAKGSENAVTCNCSFDNATLCHVVSIVVKKKDLQGVLPPELVRLPFLREIDLTRNYLNGSIPPEWGSLKLVNISLLGNRLTGPIPKALANISTLTSLVIECNQLSGSLPPELGNLPSLERINLSSNNFTGALPETFAKLTTLGDFRISDNHFTGQIPDFIQKWTNLEILVIQASGLVGPIPSAIAALTKLSYLSISDLNGTEATFPPLGNMKKMKSLILRSCNIIGQLPEYVGQMTTLSVLDLSFNKLSGEIPSSFIGLIEVSEIYLTGNLLTGPVPLWMTEKGKNIDLSYNNFTADTSQGCQYGSVNLFASSSNANTFGGILSCLRTDKCQRTYYSLHINCGGEEVMVNGNTTFEEDEDHSGPSRFFETGSNWAFSNTGHFLDNEGPTNGYIGKNTTRLMMNDSDLYTQARLSPISLTYYGFCMGNGNYTVNLHFAEIMLTDDKSFSSLGRRIFDVYIQGKLVLKDFNIKDEAGGAGKVTIKNFTVAVTDNTLEIRFFWAGKGTIGMPYRGVYGPLISAISVNRNFIPQSEHKCSSVSVGTVVGIVAGSVFSIILVWGILWWKGCIRPKSKMDLDLKGRDLHTRIFTLRQIKAATNNFDLEYKIGEGGFGPVYKGLLADGSLIAVKQLSSKSKQGNREFVNEIGMISALQHPHLVKLYGCCIEGNQLLLVYEYLENNSLARALFGPKEHRLNLDWPTRHKICVGIARGLTYLHEESRLKIVHRDIKASNVLLDKNLNSKISDFGLAKLDEEDNTHISTRVAGTFGYMAPEYAMRGYLTDKADVYSFGIVTLEIVSGRSITIYRQNDDAFCLLDWAHVLKDQGKLMELVDPRLGLDFNEEEVMVMINVALLCSDVSPSVRPAMSTVVSMLQGRVDVQDFVSDSVVSVDEETKFEAIRKYYRFNQEQVMNKERTQTLRDGTLTASSTSAADFYPVNLDSDYFKGRD